MSCPVPVECCSAPSVLAGARCPAVFVRRRLDPLCCQLTCLRHCCAIGGPLLPPGGLRRREVSLTAGETRAAGTTDRSLGSG